MEKKKLFLARSAAFQQKKEPSLEEIKDVINKESQKRRFGNELNRTLQAQPGKSSVFLELMLKNKYAGIIEEKEPDQPSQSNETIDNSLRTFNLPPQQLLAIPAGLKLRAAPVPRRESIIAIQKMDKAVKDVVGIERSPWYYVVEGEETPYFWNVLTNETTFDRPDNYIEGNVYKAPPDSTTVSATTTNSDVSTDAVLWQEETEDNGEISYLNLSTGVSRQDRPVGPAVVVVQTEEGGEEDWQVMDASSGSVYYRNSHTGEERADRPLGGYVVIAESTTTTN